MTYRLLRASLVVALVALGVVAGCGRSDLTVYVWDSGTPDVVDGGACSPVTCPNGCCDPSGTCRTGTELNACGVGGVACSDCQQQGFDFCDSQIHACGKIQPTCDVSNCSTGCCTLFNGQQACVSGVSSLACGGGGQKCVDCTQNGQVCDPNKHACENAPCGPNNCKGCCTANDTCVNAQSDTQCGIGGLSCTDCTQQKEVCNTGNGQCTNIQPQCTPQNCPGCCAGDICVKGGSDNQCGAGGKACVDCTAQKETCSNGACVSTCTAQNCPGCCEQGTCFAGFVDSRCGSGGAACADCTQKSETCDTTSTPRVCQNGQTTCPAAYGGCGSSVSTPVVSVTSGQCAATDLQDAQAACSLGENTTSCQLFFKTEQQINGACAKCLTPFEYDFSQGTGIFECVSPYVASSCNHSTGCASDCETQSCDQCPPGSVQQCDFQVEQGQCQSYFQGVTCIGQALFGQASFCNPQQYGGNYGDWLAAVGAHYCE